ncbi:MAG: FAD-dependent oxidoreductase [Bacteroidetes bacterium]|nr:FAD-dependent oxidoreductase [Bacteroidota bacterium]
MGTNKTNYDIQLDSSFEEVIINAYECLECGKCTAGCPIVEMFPQHFNPHHLLGRLLVDPEKVLEEKDIWFCASCYQCNKRCPQGIELPDIFLKLRRKAIKEKGLENLEKTMKIIGEKIPFPGSLFWVCFHPERIPLEKETMIKLFDKIHFKKEKAVVPRSDNKVAVIGSGPAGLFVACELIHKGYHVTIFEAQPNAGGMFRTCIPEYRLPTAIIDNDIKNIEKQGIEIKTNIKIGEDLAFGQLFKDGFSAVFIASGAHKCLKLGIPGEDLPGVTNTLLFLEDLKNNKIKKMPEKVLVIGGGNTAMDAASAAAISGSKEVHVLYRRTSKEIPADKNEIREAEEKGVKIHYLTVPGKFIGKDKIEKVECLKIELGPPDLTGRRHPVPVKDSEFEMDTDMVIVAIGEVPSVNFLPEEVMMNNDGTIAVNPLTMETTMAGVFAGGDVIYGPATVSEAIISAKKAADCIDHYLKQNEH